MEILALTFIAQVVKVLIVVCVCVREVLFDELHLDEKCSQRLSKTQVQRQKSTSEAVVRHTCNHTEN